MTAAGIVFERHQAKSISIAVSPPHRQILNNDPCTNASAMVKPFRLLISTKQSIATPAARQLKSIAGSTSGDKGQKEAIGAWCAD